MRRDPYRKANTGRGRRKALEVVDLRVTRQPRPTNAPPLPTQLHPAIEETQTV